MKYKIFIIVIFLAVILNSFGRNSNADSLKIVLKNAKQDSIRCRILYELMNESSEYDIWPVYNQQILDIAKKNSNNSSGEIKSFFLAYYTLALNNFGYLYKQLGDISKAFDYFNQALSIQKENSDKLGIAGSLINLGYLCRQQGNIAKALDYYHYALKIQVEINNKQGIAVSYNNIGYVYDNQGEFINALEYYNKALDIYKEINDKNGVALCYLNISSIYSMYGDINYTGVKTEKIKRGHIKAIDYLNKSIIINEEISEKEGLASALNCLGGIYKNFGDPQCNLSEEECKKISHKKALEHYSRSLKIQEEIKNKVGMAISHCSISELFLSQGKINEAYMYAMHCLKISKELGYPDKIKDAAFLLKKIYEKQNQHQKALKMYELYIQMRDSVINQENKKTTFKKQFQIEYEIQATKDSILNAAKIREEKMRHEQAISKQRFYTFGGLIGFVLMLMVAGISIKAYKNKKQANILLAQQNTEILQQKEEISTQRDEIETQRDKLTEQNNKLEEQKQEITDSINYAKRIQQAVLPDLELLFTAGNQTSDYRLLITDYFILFKPKDIVSGDFYWAIKINELLIITVADCTGHGVPGAFMSMLGISFLNEIVRKKEITKASEILDELRTSVIDALKQKGDSGEQKDGMDIALCAINTDTLEMQFAGANNPCYIVSSFKFDVLSSENNIKQETSNFKLIELKGDKQPIGIHSNMLPFTNQLHQLQKGDIIYLMSDGYEDQFGGPNRKKFLAKNLKKLLTASCLMLLNEQKQILENTITDWIGSGEQIDDITIIGVTM